MSTSPIVKPAITDPLPQQVADLTHPIGRQRKTPVLLTSIFVETVRGIYMPDSGLSLSQEFTYNQTQGATKIWIDGESVWNDTTPDFRPAIYVSVGPIQYTPAPGADPHTGYIGVDMKEGKYFYATKGAADISVVHIGETQGQASVLGSNTLDLLTAFSDVIRRDFCFDSLTVVRADPATTGKKESRERFRSAVTMQVGFVDRWALKLESPKLSRIVFNAGLRSAEVLGLNVTIS